MVLDYLGTAAAEGWPAIFCECNACRRAAESGGRNIRSRSQALVNGELLIDLPADTCSRVLTGRLHLSGIQSCLITHSHSDHLYAADLEMRRTGFAYPADDLPFILYGTDIAGKTIREVLARYNLERDGRVLFHPVTPLRPFSVGRYTVTALPADHDPASGPVIYLINDGEKHLLYAHDTGYFPEESWAYLETEQPLLALVSLDCTTGPLECRRGHMGLSAAREVYERLLELGCVNETTTAYVNHFSHNGGKIYDELVPLAADYGFQVSYDGCRVTV